MTQRQIPGKAYAITHIHTDASNAEASDLDPRISGAINSIPAARGRVGWAECFTPVSRLVRLLQRGQGGNGPVHIITLTDHIRRKAHRIPKRHMAAAAAEPRLAIGGEITTRSRDVDGVYRKAPEILAYGALEPVIGPDGPYSGLSQDLLDELYATCMDDEGKELDTRRAARVLRRRGIAHGLSHPFDNHELSLEGTFQLISEFPFTETVNGGYFAQSARVLDAFIRLNNAVLRGGEVAHRHLSPVGQRIIQHIRRHGRPIQPWGGSDAHSHDFDRVVMAMDPGAGRRAEDLRPRDLFQAMLAWEHGTAGDVKETAPPATPFTILGRAATPAHQVADVTAIVLRNFRMNGLPMLNPLIGPAVALITFRITQDELRKRMRAQKQRHRTLRREFNPEALLRHVRMPDASMLVTPRRGGGLLRLVRMAG